MKPSPYARIRQAVHLQLYSLSAVVLTMFFVTLSVLAGPFEPTNWPPTINANATVDYYIVDPAAAFDTPPGWSQTVSFAGGGDQAYMPINLSGLEGDESTSSFMNIADNNYHLGECPNYRHPPPGLW